MVRSHSINTKHSQLKPAFVTTVPELGGAEVNLLRLIRQQRSDGIGPAVVLIASGNGLADRFRSAHLPVSEFSLYRWQWDRPWRYIQSLVQLALPIAASGASLLHINHYYALEYTTRAAKLARLPYIVHMRGIENLDWVKANRRYFLGAARVVAVSRAAKNRLVRGGVPASLIDVIYDGVEEAEFSNHSEAANNPGKQVWATSSNTKVIGIVGRVDPIKGIDQFLHAAASISRTIPDTKFVIAGGGVSSYLVRMKDLARRLEIYDQVVFAGFQEDVAQVLHALDVLVVATHDPINGRMEACPNIILEAMAARTPVVATRSGGVEELLADDRGLLATPGDPDDLSDKIREMIFMSNGERNAMICRAHDAVCSDFSIKKQTRSFETLYEQILAG